MSQSTSHRVFVYGSLKRGQGNSGLLEGAALIARTEITGNYRLLDLGYFPGVVRDNMLSEPRTVVGEVYDVDSETFFSLDLLEGHPTYYKRESVDTPVGKAWVYFLPPTYIGRYDEVDGPVWNEAMDELAGEAA